MSVTRVTESSATSETSFDDAVEEAAARATQTLRGVEGAAECVERLYEKWFSEGDSLPQHA